MLAQLRRSPRLPVHSKMVVSDILTVSGELIHRNYNLTLADISLGGLSFNSKFPIPPDTLLHLHFSLNKDSIRCVAKVLYSQKSLSGYYRIGCCSVQITPADLQKISRYLEPSTATWQCPACACLNCYNRVKCSPCEANGCFRPSCPKRFPYQT